MNDELEYKYLSELVFVSFEVLTALPTKITDFRDGCREVW
jgi:hypothetical protein